MERISGFTYIEAPNLVKPLVLLKGGIIDWNQEKKYKKKWLVSGKTRIILETSNKGSAGPKPLHSVFFFLIYQRQSGKRGEFN